MNINVYNLHENNWTGRTTLIMRPNPLGNPFVVGRDGKRSLVIESYRRWLFDLVNEFNVGADLGAVTLEAVLTEPLKCALRACDAADLLLRRAAWEELLRLLKRARAGEVLNLVCCCKPLDCHGDVIRRCLEWLNVNLKEI